MKYWKKWRLVPLFTLLSLCLGACSGTVDEGSLSSTRPTGAQGAAANLGGELAMDAAFYREDGAALSGGILRLSMGEAHVDSFLNEKGQLRMEGLPREGELSLTLLDDGEQAMGSVTLLLTAGVVIDASMDRDGRGHIILKEDTENIALDFTLREDGSLQCALRLT